LNLICHLREIRGDRPITEIQGASGINRGTLSQIERGLMLPLDRQIEALERAYGAPAEQWYSRAGLRAIQEDAA
jgi:transcriptional regulator with XRE-family HTH domain